MKATTPATNVLPHCIPQTEEAGRRFREWIVATGLNESISGTILFKETIREQTKDGVHLQRCWRKQE